MSKDEEACIDWATRLRVVLRRFRQPREVVVVVVLLLTPVSPRLAGAAGALRGVVGQRLCCAAAGRTHQVLLDALPELGEAQA